jgi:hypothetical protein
MLWGAGLGVFLHRHPWGDWLATQRGEYAAAIGMLGNLAISFDTGWATVLAVSAASLLGFLAYRHFASIAPEPPSLGGYKTIWVLEDAIAITNDVIARLQDMLKNAPDPATLSKTLLQAIRLLALLKNARNGRYEPQT